MKLLIIGAALVLVGCSTGQVRSSVDLTSDSIVDAKSLAKSFVGGTLLDESSAKFKFGELSTISCKRFLASSIQYKVDYMPVSVNAKNVFGAYVGYKAVNVLFANGKPVELVGHVSDSFTQCAGIHEHVKNGGDN